MKEALTCGVPHYHDPGVEAEEKVYYKPDTLNTAYESILSFLRFLAIEKITNMLQLIYFTVQKMSIYNYDIIHAVTKK